MMHAYEPVALRRVFQRRLEPAHLLLAKRPFLDFVHICHQGWKFLRGRWFGISLDVEHDVKSVAPGERIIVFAFAASLRVRLVIGPRQQASAYRGSELNALLRKLPAFP